jgi:hypothetical protein
MRVLLFLAMTVLSAHALAGTTVTERPGGFELRARGSSTLLGQYDTLEACKAAIPAPTVAGKLEYNCKGVTYIDVEANCDGVPPPAPVTDIVIELKPSIYAADNAWTPWSVLLPDGTVKHTFTGVGAFRFAVMPDESTKTESYELRPTGVWPECWAWSWATWVPPPPLPEARVLTPADFWTPPSDSETEFYP